MEKGESHMERDESIEPSNSSNHVRVLMKDLRETWQANPSDPRVGAIISKLEETLLREGALLSDYDCLREVQRSITRPVPTGAYSLPTVKKIG
jgi:hypothetical protein